VAEVDDVRAHLIAFDPDMAANAFDEVFAHFSSFPAPMTRNPYQPIGSEQPPVLIQASPVPQASSM
jgi:hypothetical protein